jgi:hypothetical protein
VYSRSSTREERKADEGHAVPRCPNDKRQENVDNAAEEGRMQLEREKRQCPEVLFQLGSEREQRHHVQSKMDPTAVYDRVGYEAVQLALIYQLGDDAEPCGE